MLRCHQRIRHAIQLIMDVNAYLESGILELYVMDALSPAECREVEGMMELFPELHVRVQTLQATFSQLAEQQAVEPPPSLRNTVLQAITQDTPPDRPGNSNARASRMKCWKPAAAILVVCLLFMLFLFNFFKRENSQLKEQLQQQQELLNLFQNKNTEPVALKGVNGYPDAAVTVLWNPENGKTWLQIRHLPPLPQGKQFQLWYLKNGAAFNAGMLQKDDENTPQRMQEVQQADAFAITIENTGGAQQPTLDAMVVLGKI